MLKAIRAEKLFDGLSDHPQLGRTVVIEDGLIVDVVADDPALPAESEQFDTPLLAPGFIDMQINGAMDVLFNDQPTVETISRIAQGARRGGCAYLLPTFITAGGQAYRQAMCAARDALDQGVPGVLGAHLEGPFLCKARPGIHDAAAIRMIEPADIDHLLDHRSGVRLITLAPEEQPPGTIQKLADAGWIVFAGHSDAGFDQMAFAMGEGLRGVTHVFNAMSQVTPREPGVVGSALADRGLFAGIIADGHHVHPANLRLAADRLGADRLCLVTDAMPTLFGTRTSFSLTGKDIHLSDGRLIEVDAGENLVDGRLAGAHLSMIDAVRNMIRLTGVSTGEAIRMASATPAHALGLVGELGRIAPGYRAGLTLLDEGLGLLGVIVDGCRLD
ncbi:MAG: N-acetylglucosamine-6-phosphate deacetylase [Pseudomonadota bacterium]